MTYFQKNHVAKRSGISRPTINKFIAQGVLVPIGFTSEGKPLFSREQVEQLQRAKQVNPNRPSTIL